MNNQRLSTCVLSHLNSLLTIEMGYAQGMNDLLAQFLVVTDSEVDSYWMFAHYMANKRLDFMESSKMRNVGECKHTHARTHILTHISSLLSLLTALVKKLVWLLMNFKRECLCFKTVFIAVPIHVLNHSLLSPSLSPSPSPSLLPLRFWVHTI